MQNMFYTLCQTEETFEYHWTKGPIHRAPHVPKSKEMLAATMGHINQL
jgi:hypothetical protein